MFRRLLLLSLFFSLYFSIDSQAQDQRFKAGVIIGLNMAQIDGDNSNGYIKPGITGGLRGVAIITDKIELSIELLFDQRGSRSQSSFDPIFFPFKITNNYVAVPVVFNYQDWLDESEEFYKLHFHAGFAYGRLLNSIIDDEDPNSSFVQVSNFFNKDDISLLVGATFYINAHIGVTGRWSRSITPLYKNGDGPISVRTAFIPKQFTLQLLYMF